MTTPRGPLRARTIGVGGSTRDDELARLSDATAGVEPVGEAEVRKRLTRARSLMRESGMDALYLHAGSNLYYFTGTRWYPSERMVAGVLPAEGELAYIAPAFELETLRPHTLEGSSIHCWDEHESPYRLLGTILEALGVRGGRLGIDEATPFFAFDGIRQAHPALELVDATPVTRGCRVRKSAAELALMQRAKDMTLEVHRSVARILRPGISTTEVEDYIDAAHRALGAAGSSFCIVLFGPDSAYPHGVKEPKALDEGDVVLIDTGCLLHGYNSDITRTYVYGTPSERQREVWEVEKGS